MSVTEFKYGKEANRRRKQAEEYRDSSTGESPLFVSMLYRQILANGLVDCSDDDYECEGISDTEIEQFYNHYK